MLTAIIENYTETLPVQRSNEGVVQVVANEGLRLVEIMEMLVNDQPHTDIMVGCLVSQLVHKSYNFNGPIHKPENLIKVGWEQICNPEAYFNGKLPRLTSLYVIFGPNVQPDQFETTKPFALAFFDEDMFTENNIQCIPHFFVYDDGEENITTSENKIKVSQVLSWIRKSSCNMDIMIDGVDSRFLTEVNQSFNCYNETLLDCFNLPEKVIRYAVSKFNLELPENIFKDKLIEDDLDIVCTNSYPKYCKSYLRSILEQTLCLREKDTNKLIAWAAYHKSGSPGILFVVPEYRRLKLASVVSERIVMDGLDEKRKAEQILLEHFGKKINIPKFIWARCIQGNEASKALIKPFAEPYQHSVVFKVSLKTSHLIF